MTTEKKTKRVSKPKVEKAEPKEVILIKNKTYKVEALSGSKHLKEGKVYEITGQIAKVLLSKGYIKLI